MTPPPYSPPADPRVIAGQSGQSHVAHLPIGTGQAGQLAKTRRMRNRCALIGMFGSVGGAIRVEAGAGKPALMAHAMATGAGRAAFIHRRRYASAFPPVEGVIG